MKIYRLPVGGLMANCYVIETENKNAVAVDTGADFQKISDFLEGKNLSLKKILLTHGHFDHIGAVQKLCEKYNCEVFVHELDAHMLRSRYASLADAINNGEFDNVESYSTVKNGDIISVDELDFEVIHTPGHTKGGVCYKCENSLFTGDTLFRLSMGRTDFPSGSMSDMFESLKKLGELEGDFEVLPGHNEPSTLSFERKNNPYLKGNPYENFI